MLGDADELDRHLVQHGYPEVATYTPDYFFQNISNVKILILCKFILLLIYFVLSRKII